MVSTKVDGLKKNSKLNLIKLVMFSILLALFVGMFTGNVNAVGNHSMQETVSSSDGEVSISMIYMIVDIVSMFVRSPILLIILVIVILVVVVIIKKNSQKIKEKLKDSVMGALELKEGIEEAKKLKRDAMIAEMQQRDPNFSEEQFISKAQNMFVQLQNAWSQKNWQLARMYETDTLFNAHNRQFEDIVSKNRTNYVENITFVNTDVVEYSQDGINDIVKVLFEVRLIDYTVDDYTGEVVFGDRRKILHLKYLYTFIRTKGVVTEGGSSINTTKCPSCGAPINVNASGMCEYCGTTVVNGTYDWVVSNVESKPHYTV